MKFIKTLEKLILAGVMGLGLAGKLDAEIIFQEDFESYEIDDVYNSNPLHYPEIPMWNNQIIEGSGNAHPDLGNKVMKVWANCIIKIPPQDNKFKLDYDVMLSHYFTNDIPFVHFQNAALCNTDFVGQNFTGNSIGIFKGYNESEGIRDGIYFRDIADKNRLKDEWISSWELDRWYHISRTLDIPNAHEDITITNKQTSEQNTFSTDFLGSNASVNYILFGGECTVTGLTAEQAYLDNIVVESESNPVPEPSTSSLLAIAGLGAGIYTLSKRKKREEEFSSYNNL